MHAHSLSHTHTHARTGVTLSMSTGQMRLPSRFHGCSSVAPFASASLTSDSMKSAEALEMTGVIDALSCGMGGGLCGCACVWVCAWG